MKIAITAAGPALDAQIDPRFGRCPYFLIVETDDKSFEALENPNVALGGGAGIQSAQFVAEAGARYVLTGNCGPNAHQTLSAAGVGVIVGCGGIIADAVGQFIAGNMTAASEPNVASHFGMGVSPGGAAPGFGAGGGMGMGGGMGQGGGRGMGMGGGRGMGQGGGRGMGMGGGRGMGQGGGMGMGGGAFAGQQPPVGGQAAGGDELNALKQQAEIMAEQMRQIQQRIAELDQEK